MAIKRKGVSTLLTKAKLAKTELEEQGVEAEHEEEEAVDEAEEAEQLSEEEMHARKIKEEKEIEKETHAAREKELKSMYVDALKKLTESMSLQPGKREDMIKAILKAEAKERALKREQEAEIRAIVSEKKHELESLSAPELKQRCKELDIKGNLYKEDRVESLMKHWVENDGISKAQSKRVREEREAELVAKDKEELKSMCERVGIEVFLKDVMVDRLVKSDNDQGRFLKPESNLVQDIENATPKATSKVNLVDALIMKQNQDKEKSGKEAADAAQLAEKIKELHKKSADDLKKLLAKRQLEVAGGKKDEMVKALIDADLIEAARATMKDKLMSLGSDELTKLLAARGLSSGKSKNGTVEALMAHELDVQTRLKAYEAKRTEIAAKEKDSLQSKTNNDLKEMCAAKGVNLGGGKEERINRLVEAALQNGDFDTLTTKLLRSERKQTLESMDKAALVQLAKDSGTDCLVKEVLVERILSHEDEIGEPLSKKARK